jgi:hypothetical protein
MLVRSLLPQPSEGKQLPVSQAKIDWLAAVGGTLRPFIESIRRDQASLAL